MVVIAITLNDIYELPPLTDLQSVDGIAETIIKGNRVLPTLVTKDGQRYKCKFRFCFTVVKPIWQKKPGKGLISTDGTLVALEVDGHSVINVEQFKSAKRGNLIFISFLVVVELLLLSRFFFKARK